MTAREEVQALATELVKKGFAEHAGRAMDLIARDRPDLWNRAMREPVSTAKMAQAEPIQKAAQVQVTHPPGVAKSADGKTLKSWEEQVQHWKMYPGTYERYRQHFASQR